MFDSYNELQRFIHENSTHVIGEGAIIGTSVIIFEFIDADGNGGFSILRPPGVSWPDAMAVLGKGTTVILKSYNKAVEEQADFELDGDFLDDDDDTF